MSATAEYVEKLEALRDLVIDKYALVHAGAPRSHGCVQCEVLDAALAIQTPDAR